MKGGVYGVTRGLHARFGAGRVFDTLLDETSILGLALGASVSGFLPMPEIQYLAYLHNAEDQLRGEAATLQFFSQGRYRNGMVVRIAGYGYQKRLRRALPQRRRGRRAAGHSGARDRVSGTTGRRRRDAARPASPPAKVDGSVCVVPRADRALPHARPATRRATAAGSSDLAGEHVPLGSARTYGDGDDLTILTLGQRPLMSLRVARRLAAQGIERARRRSPLARPAADRGHRPRGGRDRPRARRRRDAAHRRRLGGHHRGARRRRLRRALARVTSKDSFVPLGDAARLVLVSEDEIEDAALRLVR